jgi:hypothetical protein
MDTGSRLEEPGGVTWKDVHVGRLRTTISGKPLIWWLQAAARSTKEFGLRDSVLRRWVEQRGAGREPTAAARRPTTQATLPSADHAAEIARLQRENERLRMERDILKNCPAPWRARAA